MVSDPERDLGKAPREPLKSTPLGERVRAALRRERIATSATIARGVGILSRTALALLERGAHEGWATELDREGKHERRFAYRA